MIKLTQSLKQWLWENHKDKIGLIMLGHIELFTEEMNQEYLKEEMKRNIYELIGRIPNPENFIFEIVESEELKDYEMVSDFVGKLNENGIKIAIDDFGSGYSNLVELARLEPDYIKIDGEIVRNINSSTIHKIIAETIVYMTSKLKTELVAEYVENYELQQTIIDMHIRYSQGYLFSKPLPYEEIDSYLETFI